MCKFCDDKAITLNPLLEEDGRKYYADTITLKINSNTSKIEIDYDAYSCDSSFFATVDIKYCPFCGRKLK